MFQRIRLGATWMKTMLVPSLVSNERRVCVLCHSGVCVGCVSGVCVSGVCVGACVGCVCVRGVCVGGVCRGHSEELGTIKQCETL